MYYYLIILVG